MARGEVHWLWKVGVQIARRQNLSPEATGSRPEVRGEKMGRSALTVEKPSKSICAFVALKESKNGQFERFEFSGKKHPSTGG